MKTCSSCGAIVSFKDIYCGMCGHPLMDTQRESTGSLLGGKIFTDIAALAAKLKVPKNSILHLLNTYIQKVAPKIDYEIFDYSEQAATSFSFHSSFQTDSNKKWIKYHRCLYQGNFMSFRQQVDIIVPEACYGSKHIGLNTNLSDGTFCGFCTSPLT